VGKVGKDLEGSGCVLMIVLSWRKRHEDSVGLTGVPAKIWIKHLLNASLEYDHYISLRISRLMVWYPWVLLFLFSQIPVEPSDIRKWNLYEHHAIRGHHFLFLLWHTSPVRVCVCVSSCVLAILIGI
jgi:hypothetical protein